MSSKTQPKDRNERFNAASHFAGFLFSVVGMIVLVMLAIKTEKPIYIISFSIYGATLCFLYLSSATYHYFSIPATHSAKETLQRLDHCAIYLLIAGTYTPFCLVVLKGNWGWSLFGVIWALAAAGIVMTIFMKNPRHFISVTLYIIMGWLAVVAIVPIVKTMTTVELSLLLAGGMFYTVGAVIYGLKKPRLKPGVFSHHELWHLFVLAGSGFHFALMFFFVSPVQ